MSYRQSNSSYKDACLAPQSRLNQQNRRDSTDEGCPVIEESGTVCGETNSLNIFQEFRQMYDDCLKKLEGSVNGNTTLKKLAPFKKLIDDLWEQNTMLVETVEELEQEATYRVTNLQEKLNKSCQKMGDFKDDIKCLVKIIHSFTENGVFDLTGLKFKTFCCSSVFGDCDKRCLVPSGKGERDLRRSDITFKKTTSSLRTVDQPINEVEETIGVKCDFHDSNQPSRTLSKGRLSSNLRCSKSKQSNLKCGSISFCDEPICNYPSAMSFDDPYKCDVDSVENYPKCMPPISINFNIGGDEVCETVDCCCKCSCSCSCVE